MDIPNKHKKIEDSRMQDIRKPYNLLPSINVKSASEMSILDSWIRHMKNKDVPYCVTERATKLGRSRVLFVEKVA